MLTSRRGALLEIGAACLACALLALPSLTFPMGVDQGTLGTWAQELARGGVPYRDVWDQRPPLLHLLHYLAYAAGIRGMALTRIVDLLVAVGISGALAGLGRRLFGAGAGLIAGAFYAYSYFGQAEFSHMSTPDGLVGLPLALAFLALTAECRPRLAHWLAGVLLGVAFIGKYTAAAAFPALLAAAPLPQLPGEPPRPWRERSLAAVRMGLGAALVPLLTAGALAAIGAFDYFLADTILYNRVHQLLGPEKPELLAQAHEVLAQLLARREVIAPLLLLPLARANRKGLLAGFGWLAAGALMVLAQRKFYSYHFTSLVPALALLTGAALRGVAVRLASEPAPRLRKLTWALAFAIALGAGFRTAAVWGRSARAAWDASRSPEARLDFFALHRNPLTGFALIEDIAVAQAIRERARPGDRLQTYGPPLLYYLSQLPPASRFIFNIPLVSKGHLPRYDEEFSRSIRERPPEFVAVYRGDRVPAVTGYDEPSEALLRLQPALQEALSRMQLLVDLPTVRLYAAPGRGPAVTERGEGAGVR